MLLNSPVAAPCSVTRRSGIMTLNSPNGSTLQCGRWLWDDIKWNSPKRPPYWNSTSGFEFYHITVVDIIILHQSAKFYQNRTTLSRKKNKNLAISGENRLFKTISIFALRFQID